MSYCPSETVDPHPRGSHRGSSGTGEASYGVTSWAVDVGKLARTRGPHLTTCDPPPEIASVSQGPFPGKVKADFIKGVRELGKK